VADGEAHRRAEGRKRWNAVRRLCAELRRAEVLRLLAAWGWERGTQSRIAEHLGVDRSTISRDLQKLLPLVEPCPTCGTLRPRNLV